MAFLATVDASPRPESMKFAVFSQLAGNLGSRDGFARDSLLQRGVYREPVRAQPPRDLLAHAFLTTGPPAMPTSSSVSNWLRSNVGGI